MHFHLYFQMINFICKYSALSIYVLARSSYILSSLNVLDEQSLSSLYIWIFYLKMCQHISPIVNTDRYKHTQMS